MEAADPRHKRQKSEKPSEEVDRVHYPSEGEAKRTLYPKAIMEFHAQGDLSSGLSNKKKKGTAAQHSEHDTEDENVRELHATLVPSALRVPLSDPENPINLCFYYIRFIPIPEDRHYRMFGLFVKVPLPKEAETMEVDLHLRNGRVVKTGFVPSGVLPFDKDEIMIAQNFQEMFLKIILDRSEFFSDFVPLGMNNASQHSSSTFYLLLPVKKHNGDSMVADWTTVRQCLSSPIFGHQRNSFERVLPGSAILELLNGPINECEILNSLVFAPYNKIFYFIDGIDHESNANSQRNGSRNESHAEYYQKRYGIKLLHLEQPILKAKSLFSLRNLLLNRIHASTEAREVAEKFLELPPELCSLKIIGFSKDIGSSLSLLPSLMHRLESLLVAIELKDTLSTNIPEGSKIRADSVLEALTTEKCLERFSLERFEVLGDAFLKYAVGRHYFLSHETLDEGQLTMKRSSIVKNVHLYELACRKNLQVYIRDEKFDPSQLFALGRPCAVVCNVNTASTIHSQQGNGIIVDGEEANNVKCTKFHRWLYRKTIADVVEALVGAFLVESGFKAATAFLKWIGIEVNFEVSDVHRVCKESMTNMPLINNIDVVALETVLGYRFQHRGLLLQAFVHPSFNKHSGECYQKLEFLGDAVFEYLITSYLYSGYPDLKPGQITDLKSVIVNNNSFAHIAVWRSFHVHLIKDDNSLTGAISKFESFLHLSESERDLLEEPACPKVLGDIVESCIGAILLDTGFNLKQVWTIMLMLLEPVFSFSTLQLNPVRELRELCQQCNFELGFPYPVKDNKSYFVKVEIDAKGEHLTCSAINHNSKAAGRSAAQEALSMLKALGYVNKHKSLEEIVRITRKMEPRLIGYDEEPIVIDNTDSIQLEMVLKSQGTPSKLTPRETDEASSPTGNKVLHTPPTLLSMSEGRPPATTDEAGNSSRDGGQTDGGLKIEFTGDVEHGSHKKSSRILSDITAKSRLFEICAANYWKPPAFVLCEEESPNQEKRFIYKVTVEVETITSTILECFSESRSKKKAAQEHAAEGALWFLKHLGYT